VKLYVHAPIPAPELWIMSAEARPPPATYPLAGGEMTVAQAIDVAGVGCLDALLFEAGAHPARE
jgi:hypothetical protein